MKDNFWLSMPKYAKWDELLDNRTDDYLLARVLPDAETGVVLNERDSYTLYGPDEALLYRPQSFITKLSMGLYLAVCVLLRRE